MKTKNISLKNYVGTSYEVGRQVGAWVLASPELLRRALLPPQAYPEDKFTQIVALLDQYCPGINEEIRGFSDVVGVHAKQVIFYAMTYLERGCSLMAALPAKTENAHTLMARNYDFNDEIEELCFAYTAVEGKYAYIGSSLHLFGRGDGMNEHGLAVCQAGNGLPVGNFEGGQKAGVTGFQLWIVMRSILENCKTVEEALAWAMGAPIGFNINLMLADSHNTIALFQCIDGHKAYEVCKEGDGGKTFLSSTNHTLFEEIRPYEKMVIENSVIRNQRIVELFERKKRVSTDDIKGLLSTSYPDGLCCHYYGDFFGTLRSMLFDVTDKTIELTFGSPQANAWRTFPVAPLTEQELPLQLPQEKAEPAFYNILK